MCSASNCTTITDFAVFLMQLKTAHLVVAVQFPLDIYQDCILDYCSSVTVFCCFRCHNWMIRFENTANASSDWNLISTMKECSGSFEDVSGNTVKHSAEFRRNSKEWWQYYPDISDKDTLYLHCYQVNDCQEYIFQLFSTLKNQSSYFTNKHRYVLDILKTNTYL